MDSVNYLHYEFDAGPQDAIEVVLDKAANVLMLDQINYQHYRSRERYDYHGGYVTVSPYVIQPPRQDHWHIVIDLGGRAGTVRASVRRLPQLIRQD